MQNQVLHTPKKLHAGIHGGEWVVAPPKGITINYPLFFFFLRPLQPHPHPHLPSQEGKGQGAAGHNEDEPDDPNGDFLRQGVLAYARPSLEVGS